MPTPSITYKKCQLCSMRYQRRGYLIKHYRKVHGLEEPPPHISHSSTLMRQEEIPPNEPSLDQILHPQELLEGNEPMRDADNYFSESTEGDIDELQLYELYGELFEERYWNDDDMRDLEYAKSDQLVGPYILEGRREQSPLQLSQPTSQSPQRIDFPHQCAIPIATADDSEIKALIEDNLWKPFFSSQDFRLMQHFIITAMSQNAIPSYFNAGLHSKEVNYSFSSGNTLWQRLIEMGNHLPRWKKGSVGPVDASTPFYYRDAVETIRYLLQQRAYKGSFLFEPYAERGSAEAGRIYTEITSGEWFWEKQQQLPPGGTLLSVICASDKTRLTRMAGDKYAWPIYLTLGNIKAAVRNLPSRHCYIVVALLPILEKVTDPDMVEANLTKHVSTQKIQQIIEHVFHDMHSIPTDGLEMECGDGCIRRCWPILCSWLADHQEHCFLQGLKSNACPKCTTPWREFQDYQSPELLRQRARTEKGTKQLLQSFRDGTTTKKELSEHGFRETGGCLWDFDLCDAHDLHRPDILHNIHIGMLHHLMKWVQDLLEEHDRLNNFDTAWISSTSYPNFVRPTKAYRYVTQWTGKEMHNLANILLPCFAAALVRPTPDQRQPFAKALKCVRYFLWFHMLTLYTTHDDGTLRQMDTYLRKFHKHKEVFRECRKKKQVETDIAIKATEMRAERDVKIQNLH